MPSADVGVAAISERSARHGPARTGCLLLHQLLAEGWGGPFARASPRRTLSPAATSLPRLRGVRNLGVGRVRSRDLTTGRSVPCKDGRVVLPSGSARTKPCHLEMALWRGLAGRLLATWRTSAHQRKAFWVKPSVGASSVVCPCIAVMGVVPAAGNRVVETPDGAASNGKRD